MPTPAKRAKRASTNVAARIDLGKMHPEQYVAKPEPALLQIGQAKYLAADGTGRPGGESFQAAVESLYGTAYTLKFMSKASGQDFKVMGLEGLWDTAGTTPAALSKDWSLLIRVPDFITPAQLRKATASLRARKKEPRVVRLRVLREGLCVQCLHVGAYAAEAKTVGRMVAFAAAQGHVPKGPHHEIYLNDPRKVPPARLKTILRYPVRRVKTG